jgi:Tol biopolymer transport system component
MGTNRWVTWSRDGNYIAYVSERPTEKVINIRAADTGELVRELRPAIGYFGWISWSPDNSTFAVAGRDLKGLGGVFLVDARAQDVRPVRVAAGGPPEWAPDGRNLYYVRRGTSPAWAPAAEASATAPRTSVVIAHDLKTGQEREIAPAGEAYLSVSPDGSLLALSSTNRSEIQIISTVSGQTRVLARAPTGRLFERSVGWTPDSSHAIARMVTDSTGSYDRGTGELFAVSLATGEMKKLDVDVRKMGPLSPIRVHPDGRRLAFFTRDDNPIREVYAFENFLPALDARR